MNIKLYHLCIQHFVFVERQLAMQISKLYQHSIQYLSEDCETLKSKNLIKRKLNLNFSIRLYMSFTSVYNTRLKLEYTYIKYFTLFQTGFQLSYGAGYFYFYVLLAKFIKNWWQNTFISYWIHIPHIICYSPSGKKT